MDNQHRKIKGYRELSQAEIDLINEIKEHGERTRELIAKCAAAEQAETTAREPWDNATLGEAARWRAIARTDFQTGVMALTRSVAKPEFF